MDNFNYGNYNRPPKKRRGGASYFLVAIIGAIIGGIITSYIAQIGRASCRERV